MTKNPPVVKNFMAAPNDKEIMESVIKAACQYYEISEDELMNQSKKADPVAIRRMSMYLIMKNTSLRDYVVAERFGITRTPLNDSVGIIEVHAKIYRQTSGTLQAIANIANNFEKKYAWHIQSTNTIS